MQEKFTPLLDQCCNDVVLFADHRSGRTPQQSFWNDERGVLMRQILTRAAMANHATNSYMRRPITADDLRLCPEARALLHSLDNRVLPVHLACRFPRVMNEIARLWRRPARLDRYFDDLLIDQRGGRQGLPFAVATELAALKDYYQTEVYPKRECVWQKVYSLPTNPQKESEGIAGSCALPNHLPR